MMVLHYATVLFYFIDSVDHCISFCISVFPVPSGCFIWHGAMFKYSPTRFWVGMVVVIFYVGSIFPFLFVHVGHLPRGV